MYSKKTLEYFMHPKNIGEIKNCSGKGKVGSPVCGDVIDFYIKVDNKTKKIIDAKFMSFGCASNIATSSILTELIIGKTIDEAKKITFDDITKELGGLPKIKIHCSVLAINAMNKAIEDYQKKSTD